MRQLQMETDSEQVALTLGHAIVQPILYSIHLGTKLLHAKWQNIQYCGVVTSESLLGHTEVPTILYISTYVHTHVCTYKLTTL